MKKQLLYISLFVSLFFYKSGYSQTMNFTVNNPPSIICGGTSVLSANTTVSNVTFTWTPQNGGQALIGNPVTTPVLTANQTYIVTATAPGVSFQSQTAHIQVDRVPSIILDGSSDVPCGSTYTLRINGTVPSSSTFEWFLVENVTTLIPVGTGSTFTATAPTNIAQSNVNGGQATRTYVLRMNGNPGCLSNTVNVSFKACPSCVNSTNLTPQWATYFGGSGADQISSMALTPTGNLIVYGNTNGITRDLPTSPGTIIRTMGSFGSAGQTGDLFVAEITPDGTRVNWINYIGGSEVDEAAFVLVDENGDIYLTANTKSGDFPVSVPPSPTNGLFHPNENNVVSMKLTPGGQSVVWSRFYGAWDLKLEGANLIPNGLSNQGLFLSGTLGVRGAGSLPNATNNYKAPLVSRTNMFVARINKVDGKPIWGTYFGACSCPAGIGIGGKNIAFDAQGDVYCSAVTGCNMTQTYLEADGITTTVDPDFPLRVANSTSPYQGLQDALIVKFNGLSGTTMWWDMWGTVFNDFYTGLSIRDNDLLLTGAAGWINIPNSLTPSDIILERRNRTAGTSIARRLHAGSSGEYGKEIYTDVTGNVYVCGDVSSTDLIGPNASAYHRDLTGPFGTSDMFIGKFDANFTPIWQTYYGSASNTAASGNESAHTMVLDGNANIYVAGSTFSSNYEVIGSSSIQHNPAGASEGAIVKFGCINCTNCKEETMEEARKEFIQLYPNPFTDKSVLTFTSSDINQLYSVEINDLRGTTIFRQNNVKANTSLTLRGNYPSGIYIVKIISGNDIKTYKLVKTD